MPINYSTLMLIVIVVALVAGFLLIRSAWPSRTSRNADATPPGGAEKVCPDKQCGHRNTDRATFCARCGKRLQRG